MVRMKVKKLEKEDLNLQGVTLIKTIKEEKVKAIEKIKN